MAQHRRGVGLTRWSLLATTVAILVVVNLLANGWFMRLDLTQDKEFTVSEGTRTLLESLDDTLLVRGYFTQTLPPPYNRNRQILTDLLDEYQSISGGRVRFEFVDPAEQGDNPEQEMAGIGIPMIQVTDVSSDKVEMVNGFMGVAVLFEDQQEIIPVVQSGRGLEFLLTSKIRKLTGSGRTRVGIMQGFDSPVMADDMQQMLAVLGEQYQLRGVDLEAGEALGDLDALLVVAPKRPMSEWALAQIDRFLAQGGGLGVFAGAVGADLSTQMAQDLPPVFGDLLTGHGVTLNSDLVADRNNVRITVAQRRGMFTIQNMVDYPYIPLLNRLSRDNPVVAGLEGVSLPFVSSLNTEPDGAIAFTELANTSRASWRINSPYDIGPLINRDTRVIEPSAKGPHTVAVAGEGRFESVYAGREVISPTDDGGEPQVVPQPETPADGRLMVVGSGEFMRDAYLMDGSNLPFVMNAIDWLSGDESLIALRSRGVTDRPLMELSDAAMQGVKALNILGGAVLLIGIGLLRWRFSQSRRRALQRLG